jgi:signal transduction histidine kinase
VTLAVTERATGVTHYWQLPGPERTLSVTSVTGDAAEASRGLGVAGVCLLRRLGGRLEIEDSKGRRKLTNDAVAALLPPDAGSALVGEGAFGDGWTARLVLLDPSHEPGARGRRWLSTLLPQAGMSLYSVYLLGRLRSQATAMERARLARELHDGVIQSLVGLEMRVDVLRRQLHEGTAARELEEIQARLHAEALNVRELMNEIRPVSGDGDDVPALLAEIAERFRRDSGIDTRFLCSANRVPLTPPRVRELVRITQESLVNVRKHSGARKVILRLAVVNDGCVLTVDDDGRGFEFEGRYTLDELDDARRGPLVIKERVRQLGGTLVLDSAPGRGSRLEIAIPRGVA